MRMSTAFACIFIVALARVSNAQPDATGPEAGDAHAPMNVLFILTDDQRADTLAPWGGDAVETPALDALASRGTSFLNTYCMGSHSGAVCGPSRAMILTGRDLNRIETPFNLNERTTTLPEPFRDAGYNTFYTGKWHNGKGAFTRGFTHGSSIFFGGMGSHTELPVHDFDPTRVYDHGARRPLHEFSSTEFVSGAIEFLRARAASPTVGENTPAWGPFFAMVSFTAPHDPRTPPPEYAAMYDPDSIELPANFKPVHPFDNGEMTIRDERLAAWPRTEDEVRRHLADYYAMVSHTDAQIGRLLDELDTLGLADSTIVVFASDHGLAVGSHGLMGKQNLYEHSTKAPLIVYDPRRPGAGATCPGLFYLHDLHPTIAELAGLPPIDVGEVSVSRHSPQARSFAGCVDGCDGENDPEGDCAGRHILFTLYRDLQRSVRDERWKLIVYPKINRVQLFDLETDPHERLDRSRVMAGHVLRLREGLRHQQAYAKDGAPLESESPGSGDFDAEAAEAGR